MVHLYGGPIFNLNFKAMNIIYFILLFTLCVLVTVYFIRPLLNDLFIKSNDEEINGKFSDYKYIFDDNIFKCLIRIPDTKDEIIYDMLGIQVKKIHSTMSFLYSHIVFTKDPENNSILFFIPRFSKVGYKLTKTIEKIGEYPYIIRMRQEISIKDKDSYSWEGYAHTKEQGKMIFKELLNRAGYKEYAKAVDDPDIVNQVTNNTGKSIEDLN